MTESSLDGSGEVVEHETRSNDGEPINGDGTRYEGEDGELIDGPLVDGLHVSKEVRWLAARGALREFHASDLGNGQRFARLYGDRIKYVPATDTWYGWDRPSGRWVKDEGSRRYRYAENVIGSIHIEALMTQDEDLRRRLRQHAWRSAGGPRIREMLRIAANDGDIQTRPDIFDADPTLLAVKNGVLDLRTGTLRRARQGDYLTRMAPVEYDPQAACPIFRRFLNRIFEDNAPLIGFVQRALGYSLTGDTRERCFFLLHGAGRNGKTTLLEVFRAVMGTYAMRARAATLLTKRHEDGAAASGDVHRLQGARFVTASEIEEGRRFGEGLIKDITGNGTITARPLYGREHDFVPQFKFWIDTNHRPVIKGTDNAMWDRVRLIPFNVRITDAELNPTLVPYLVREELPGILAWAVEGCLGWQRERGLGAPVEVVAATQSYRDESDILSAFLTDKCIVGPQEQIPSTVLYNVYRGWANENGERPLTQTALAARLKARGFCNKPTRTGIVWHGLRALV